MENAIRELLEMPLKAIGIRIFDISYIKEDNNKFLRIVIDKDGGVDLDTCVEATHIINDILDKNDIIKESYILDVCSVGR